MFREWKVSDYSNGRHTARDCLPLSATEGGGGYLERDPDDNESQFDIVYVSIVVLRFIHINNFFFLTASRTPNKDGFRHFFPPTLY